jgi:multiple sugar transport system substrate-binding protein
VLGSAGCARADDPAVRFWAMGREGEVVTELLQGFYKEQPDVPVRVEQLPWSAAHEKLLTAFAGDATPDLAQLGNTWLPELVALGALEPLDALALGPRRAWTGRLLCRHLGHQCRGRQALRPALVRGHTRAVLPARPAAQAGYNAPPRTWAEWLQMQHAIKRVVGPDTFAVLLPLNEYDPLVALSLQQADPLLREGGRFGNFRSADFGRTLDFYLVDVHAEAGATGQQQ